MNDVRTCEQCGAVLDFTAPEGLCPRCVLATVGNIAPDNVPETDAPDAAPRMRPFGDYELVEEIARGGMGVVWKARQVSLNRIVAVKMILAGEFASREQALRFRLEAEAAARLQHPNIVRIHETGEMDGQPYFSMDYVEGRSLSELVSEKPLAAKRAAACVRKIAEAIHYAHEQGILHRDLKPSNVLIDMHDEPRITDFGLAKRVERESFMTVTGQVLGSPNFMPPEQADAKLGRAGRYSDVYGLGGILFYLVTGRPPFVAETIGETILHVLNTEPVSPRLLNPSVPQDIATICLKCLEKQPAKRYQTAQQLAEELTRFLNDEPIRARPISRVETLWRWCRRNPRLATSLGALAAVFISGFVGVSWQWHQARRENRAARLNLYVGDMNLAQQSIAAGNLGRAMQLLERHRPKRGEPDFRGFEWRYLWGLCQGDRHVALPGHSDLVWSGEFSPTGKTFVTCDASGHVRVWNSAARRLLTEFEGGGSSIAFFPDGNTLAVASSHRIRLLDTTSWTEQESLGAWQNALKDGHAPVALSRDGRMLAAMCADGVRVFDTRTWREIRRLPKASGPLAFAPDGSILATDAPEGITLWPLIGSSPVRVLESSASLFAFVNAKLTTSKCIAFSLDGAWLAAADNRSPFAVTIWEVLSGRKVGSFSGEHHGEISTLAFSPDGQTLATGAWDHSIRLWDFSTRRCRATLRGHLHEVWLVSFSPDGKTLLSGSKDGATKLWDLSHSGDADACPGHARPLAFSADAQTLAAVSTNWVLQFHDLQTRKTTDVFSFPAAAVKRFFWYRRQYVISPDLANVAFCLGEEKVQVWNIAAGELIAEWSESTNRITGIVFAPDGNTLLMACARHPRISDDFGEVKFWQFKAAQIRSLATQPWTIVSRVVYSPDGRLFATAHHHGVTIVWDAATLNPRAILQMPDNNDWVFTAAFSTDNRFLATANLNNTAGLWELSSRKFLGAFVGHKQGLGSVAFSPDGKTLITGGNDGTIRFWNIETRQEVLSFSRPGLHPLELIFSPDGNVLVSGSASFSGSIPQFPLLRAASWAEADAQSNSPRLQH